MNKLCSKCNIEKPISEFNKRSNSKDGLRFDCRECQKLSYESKREYYIGKMKANRFEKIDEYVKRDKQHYEENKVLILEKKKQYAKENNEAIKERGLIYRKHNKTKLSEVNKKWRLENNDYIKSYQKEYNEKNKDRNKYIVLWRSVLKSSLKRLGKSKEGHTIDLLGYSALDLKNHLQSLFTEGMTWENYGEWHIDHIKDVVLFDKNTNPSVVNALNNLRPLWATTREINGVVYEGNLNKKKTFKKDLFFNVMV